ncbi:SixA phosphatase family protein [Streptomyces sp. NEAU-W12]|uniref:SixA phosphatase family protein n=1 Tax=Streptomyces sp. NEAU-W12 TaxID=2994668 RepID=UPI00224B119F|nr:histidine phosphatase family protein [Streptomyces sp. NEAU-W12]MCX2924870.1 histidine phosphatase family protein [Streptomyces sp. NEAU-W12]
MTGTSGGTVPTERTGSTERTGDTGTGPPRRLVVLRHAKSAWPEGVPDHDRPLAARGERDAPAAGRAIAGTVGPPGLVLCSTAVRARRTWEPVAAQWDTPPPVRYEPRLYAAGVPDLLAVVREVPAEVGTLLLIGHNPGLADLVLTLAGDDVDDTLDRVRAKFPTSAVAVLSWRGAAWTDLAPGTALLTAMTVPRGTAR